MFQYDVVLDIVVINRIIAEASHTVLGMGYEIRILSLKLLDVLYKSSPFPDSTSFKEIIWLSQCGKYRIII